VASLLTLPLLGAVATESLPMKRAKFRESGKKVKMEISLPALLKTSDRAAMDQVSAGFATRLVYDLGVFRWGERKPSASTRIVRRIYFDIFNEEYIVEQSVDGRLAWVQRRKLRDDAVKLAVHLDVRVCDASALVRGGDAIYVVRVLAQRNPIEARAGAGRRGRGHDRNQGWFADWVGAFVSSPPEAEYTIEARSSAFYLLER
jgi:hypothetical protein